MITSLVGENTYEIRQELNRLISELGSDSKEVITRIEGYELEMNDLNNALFSNTLFGPNGLVVLSRLSEAKDQLENVTQLLEKVDDQQDVIIYEPKIDKRSGFYKFLMRNTNAKEFRQLDEPALITWMLGEARTRGGDLSRPQATKLINIVGNDQWRLSNELDKLIAQKVDITDELIDELVEVSPNESIFELLDSATKGHVDRTTELYDKLIQQQMEPMYILSMIAWQLFNMLVVITATDQSESQISADTKISPFVISKTKKLTANMTLSDIRALISLASETDLKIKTSPVNANQAVLQLLVNIAKRRS